MLARKRPDMQIVGDELHPLGKVKDFAPYIAKIKASGADSVITGNWGNDLSLLVKAAQGRGLKVDCYTYYAGGRRHAARRWARRPRARSRSSPSATSNGRRTTRPPGGTRPTASRRRRQPDFYFLRGKIMWEMFAEAIEKAKSAEPEGSRSRWRA